MLMPEARPFLTARWVHLAMLNYEVDPEILKPRVPSGTELDAFQGRTFVSMVGFQFLDTRVLGIRVPFHRDFDEVNLRFYVRRDAADGNGADGNGADGNGAEGNGAEGNGADGNRRGVVFVKEIVPRAAIAWVARRVYNENYVALRMNHEDQVGRSPDPRVLYRWEHAGRSDHLAVRASGSPYYPEETSEESFIAEHYWGYVRQRNGTTIEYRVEHPRWRVWRTSEAELDCDVAALYGSELVPYLSREPSSALLAEGSAVTVRRGQVTGP